jgi:hypothetical protein
LEKLLQGCELYVVVFVKIWFCASTDWPLLIIFQPTQPTPKPPQTEIGSISNDSVDRENPKAMTVGSCCEFCGKKCKDRYILALHLLVVHKHIADNVKNRFITCKVCGKKFLKPSTLKYHLKSHRSRSSGNVRTVVILLSVLFLVYFCSNQQHS